MAALNEEVNLCGKEPRKCENVPCWACRCQLELGANP